MQRSAAEEKAIALLGQNFLPVQVASATGLSEGRISQIASAPDSSKEIAELRFQNLARHSEQDRRADTLEATLLQKLEASAEYLMRPMEIARIYQLVNAAKRRGASAPDAVQTQNPVVPIIMPTIIIQNYTKNVNNQIVQAGDQSLVTIQPQALNGLLTKATERIARDRIEASAGAQEVVIAGK